MDAGDNYNMSDFTELPELSSLHNLDVVVKSNHTKEESQLCVALDYSLENLGYSPNFLDDCFSLVQWLSTPEHKTLDDDDDDVLVPAIEDVPLQAKPEQEEGRLSLGGFPATPEQQAVDEERKTWLCRLPAVEYFPLQAKPEQEQEEGRLSLGGFPATPEQQAEDNQRKTSTPKQQTKDNQRKREFEEDNKRKRGFEEDRENFYGVPWKRPRSCKFRTGRPFWISEHPWFWPESQVRSGGFWQENQVRSGGEKRRCSHCQTEKTPQWRIGPDGAKTLCNACGVRYKSGRLVPEYRPASSPTFDSLKHSNFHRKIMKRRAMCE